MGSRRQTRRESRSAEELARDPRLKTRDVADRLGVTTNFVIGEIEDGRLPALVLARPGKRRMYRITEAFQTWARRYRWTPAPPR